MRKGSTYVFRHYAAGLDLLQRLALVVVFVSLLSSLLYYYH
nr:hypothetical protein [Brevibacillus laterosporus]